MNELKIFEGTQVGILQDGENFLFEVYSTGMALGHSKENEAGMIYPRKERIDASLQRAEITPSVHGGHKYINEEQLYDLMLEMRTDKVKPFRKWVTSEVLPSIRKTGSYGITPAIPNFADPAEAAIAWAEQYRRAQLAEATKAEIGSRREATAMNTASQAVKQVRRLEIELDRSKEYASVKAVEALTRQKFNWRPLRNYCTAHELDMEKIHDVNYGAVNTYPSEAWEQVYGVNLKELF